MMLGHYINKRQSHICYQCTCLYVHLLLFLGITKKKRAEFDPRAESDRRPDSEAIVDTVKTLLQVFPNTGMGNVWGLHQCQPDVERTEEVTTTPSLLPDAYDMIIKQGSSHSQIHLP